MLDSIDPIKTAISPTHQIEEAKKVALVPSPAVASQESNATPVGVTGDRRLTNHRLEKPEHMDQADMLTFAKELELLELRVKEAEATGITDHNRNSLASYRLLVALMKAHSDQSEEFAQLSTEEMLDIQEAQKVFRSKIIERLKEVRERTENAKWLHWTGDIAKGVALGSGAVVLVGSGGSAAPLLSFLSSFATGGVAVTQGVSKHYLDSAKQELDEIQFLRGENAYMMKDRIQQIGEAYEAVPKTMDNLMRITRDWYQASRIR